jgi:hypothetical protein
LAQEILDGTLSAGLPNNQWQLEVTRWFETSLAKLQSYIVQFVQNDVDPDGPFKLREPSYLPDDPKGFVAALQSQCTNQRIQTTGRVQSFSVLGLFLVVFLTLVIAIIAVILEKSVSLLRDGRISSRDTALQADDSLHLLRMVLENRAHERDVDHGWRNTPLGVPVCDTDAIVSRPSMGTNRLANYRWDSSVSSADSYTK